MASSLLTQPNDPSTLTRPAVAWDGLKIRFPLSVQLADSPRNPLDLCEVRIVDSDAREVAVFTPSSDATLRAKAERETLDAAYALVQKLEDERRKGRLALLAYGEAGVINREAKKIRQIRPTLLPSIAAIVVILLLWGWWGLF